MIQINSLVRGLGISVMIRKERSNADPPQNVAIMRRDSENSSPARIPFKLPGALHGYILLKQNEEGFSANPCNNNAGRIGVSSLLYSNFCLLFYHSF